MERRNTIADFSCDRKLVAPSILAADFGSLRQEIEKIETGGADVVHVDIMDGHFVPNITFGPAMCAAIRPHIKTVMDVHLMISPVDPFIDAFAKSGADILTAHMEAGPHIHRTLQAIRSAGCKAGLALNPGTGLDGVENLLDMVDLVCVMTVNPGFGGQKFIPGTLDKLREARQRIDASNFNIRLEIDGGVKTENIREIAEAGADTFVAGSAIFNTEDYKATIDAMREELEQARKVIGG